MKSSSSWLTLPKGKPNQQSSSKEEKTCNRENKYIKKKKEKLTQEEIDFQGRIVSLDGVQGSQPPNMPLWHTDNFE